MSGSTALKLPLFFDIKEAGSSIEEVAIDVINSEGQNLTSHWYHSPLDVDVYIWIDEKKNVIKQQISICGQICEWNIIDGVRTGYVLETEDNTEQHNSSIFYDKDLQRTSLFQALELLKFAEALPIDHVKQLVYNFEYNPMVDNIDPQKLLAQYGDKAQNLKGSLANFFKKLFK